MNAQQWVLTGNSASPQFHFLWMGRIFCFVSNAKSKVDEPSTLSRDYIGKHRLDPFGNVTLGFAKEQCRKQTQ